MKKNMEEVPTDIITSKDLDYLSDMFQWNYGTLKSTYNSMQIVQDEELCNLFEEANTVFDDNINQVLDILTNGGGEE